jgi:hypothetical protein
MIDKTTLEELKAKHGEVLCLKAGDSEAVFRRISRVLYKKFTKLISDPAKRDEALDQLARDCLIHPEKVAFEEMLAAKPFHAMRFAEALLKDAGAEDEAEKNE